MVTMATRNILNIERNWKNEISYIVLIYYSTYIAKFQKSTLHNFQKAHFVCYTAPLWMEYLNQSITDFDAGLSRGHLPPLQRPCTGTGLLRNFTIALKLLKFTRNGIDNVIE